MDERISLSEFTRFVEFAEKEYPNAKVMSIGSERRSDGWYHVLYLKVDGEEIYYDIPCYIEEVK